MSCNGDRGGPARVKAPRRTRSTASRRDRRLCRKRSTACTPSPVMSQSSMQTRSRLRPFKDGLNGLMNLKVPQRTVAEGAAQIFGPSAPRRRALGVAADDRQRIGSVAGGAGRAASGGSYVRRVARLQRLHPVRRLWRGGYVTPGSGTSSASTSRNGSVTASPSRLSARWAAAHHNVTRVDARGATQRTRM